MDRTRVAGGSGSWLSGLTPRRDGRVRPKTPQLLIGESKQRAPRVVWRNSLFRRLLACADVLAGGLAVSVAVGTGGPGHLTLATFVLLPVIVATSKLLGLYDRDELVIRRQTLDEAPRLFQLATLVTLLAWLLESMLFAARLERTQAVVLWGSLFLLLVIGRSTARMFARRIGPEEQCLLIGDGARCERLSEKLKASRNAHARVAGFIPLGTYSARPNGRFGRGLSVAGDVKDLDNIVRSQLVDRVIIAPTASDSDAVLELIERSKSLGVSVSLLPRIFDVVGSSVIFDDLDGITVLGVRRFGLTASSHLIKRTFDVVGAAAISFLLVPLVIFIGLAIKLDSPGPIFFHQIRVGRRGRRFHMAKFRTMTDGADRQKPELRALNEADGLFKIANDPRITRVGRILRRMSLDELPQLWNVLKGDMSLVGPRPLVVEEDQRIAGWHRRRLDLTPGMTGQWQVLGSSRIPLHEMATIDYLYVANWSLWVDLKLLLHTVPHVLAKRGL